MNKAEDSLRKRSRELSRDVWEVMDHTDPVAFGLLIERVLANEQIEDISRVVWRGSNLLTLQSAPVRADEAPLFQQFVDDYKGWKRMMLAAHRKGLALDCRKLDAVAESDPSISRFLGGYPHWVAIMMATEIIGESARRSRTAAEEQNDHGWALQEQKRHQEALDFHNEAIRLSPRFPLAWVNKGIALKNLRRYDQAFSSFDMVIEKIDPKFKRAWYNKANAILAKYEGQVLAPVVAQQVVAYLEQAIKIDAEYPLAHKLLGRLTATPEPSGGGHFWGRLHWLLTRRQ
jgi:tetratricopeptide (TPR) repeat protein